MFDKVVTETPRFVERGILMYYDTALKNMNIIKQKNQEFIFNCSIFVVIFVVISIYLLSRYKGNMTEEEKYIKEIKRRNFIYDKIRMATNIAKQKNVGSISGLPNIVNELGDFY